ncbi:hypothetical protein BDQ12DRAFT_518991 [Crucibulum laeve]|uniref:Endoplasmic reticulum-based factor for assembly of V-ATPase-domain-containing protein n=1 Tax=Crucibulum laeve TaxID=68775 RepID=A0A5C3M5P0_9AGAR|nr:hypothetical protein BDQ12DRAFT_518991 [Crucibulum laeve]
MSNSNASELNISLEPHLWDALAPLPSLLPPALKSGLTPYLSNPKPATIPYNVLQEISQWSRTTAGSASLQSHRPPLQPQSYTMIALLAGTTTSPERKFGKYVPKKEPDEVEARNASERKTVTALVNALLSIVGAGVATWWAADKTGWRNEWRVLFALFVAIVVAIAEAGLYLIWQSRRSPMKSASQTRRSIAAARHKKEDDISTLPGPDIKPTGKKTNETANLRQRR